MLFTQSTNCFDNNYKKSSKILLYFKNILYLCHIIYIHYGLYIYLQGILIYIYAFDHNPPHIHVKCGDGEFTITIKDRVVDGKAKAKTIQIVNQFVDEHEKEILEIWDKAQRGEKIEKIRR